MNNNYNYNNNYIMNDNNAQLSLLERNGNNE